MAYEKEMAFIKQNYDVINKGDMKELYRRAEDAASDVRPCEIAYVLIKISSAHPEIQPFKNMKDIFSSILSGFDHDDMDIVFPESAEYVLLRNIKCKNIKFNNPTTHFEMKNITAERIFLPEQADLSSNNAAHGGSEDNYAIDDNVDATVFIPSRTKKLGNIISPVQHGLILSLDVRYMGDLLCSKILADPDNKKEGWHMTPGNVLPR